MPAKRKLTRSLEDYLEAIFHVASRKGAARAKDIAERLGVSAASVTGALRSLGRKRLVNYAPYDVVTLTDEGDALARQVVKRHSALRDFFVDVLGINEKDAQEAACGMEHALPAPVLERLQEFVASHKRRGRKR